MSDTSIGFIITAKDRASNTFRAVGRSADGAGGKLLKLGKFGKVAALGLAAGVGAVGYAGVKLAKAAIEDQTSSALMAKQFKNSAKATDAQVAATERWITKQGIAKGVYDDDLRPALSGLVVATHDVVKARRLESLAMNVSAGKGLALSVVSKALAKGAQGQTTALGRLGIATKNADGSAKSFTQITKELGKQFAGQAATKANTLGGKIGRLKLILSETGEAIGYKLLPPLTAAATWMLNKGVPAAERLGGVFQARVLPVLQKVGGWINTTGYPALQRLGQGFETNVLPPLRQFGDFITTRVVPAFVRFGAESTKTGGLLNQWGTDVRSNFASVRSIFGSLAGFANAFWGRYGDLITKYGIGTLRNFVTVLRGGMNIVTGIFKTVAAVLHGDWGGAWNGIKQITRGGVQVVRGLFGQMRNLAGTAVKAAGRAMVDAMQWGWTQTKNAVVRGVAASARATAALPGKILAGVGNLAGLLLGAGRDVVGGLLSGIGAKAKELPGYIKSHITDLIPGAVKKFLGIKSPSRVMIPIGSAVPEGLGVGMRKGAGFVADGIGSLFGKLTSGIKKGKLTVSKALGLVRSEIENDTTKLASLRDERAGYLSTYSSTAGSLFGNGDTYGGGIGGLIAAAQAKANGASQLSSDVSTLIGKGLSKSVLKQMQDSGDLAGIHDLATGDGAQISLINALDAAATASLQKAGLATGNALRGGSIDSAIAKQQSEIALDQRLERILAKFGDAEIHIHLEGGTIVKSVKAYNRKLGQKSAGI